MRMSAADLDRHKETFLAMLRAGQDTTALLDELNAGFQLDASDLIRRGYERDGNIDVWLQCVAKDLQAGNKDGAVHLLQTLVIALTK